MSEDAKNYLRPSTVEHLFGHALTALVWVGLIRGHFYVLVVRGRKTGRAISLPVDPIEVEGHRYLDRFATEVQRFFPIPKGSAVEAFNDLAERYPVFELERLDGTAR